MPKQRRVGEQDGSVARVQGHSRSGKVERSTTEPKGPSMSTPWDWTANSYLVKGFSPPMRTSSPELQRQDKGLLLPRRHLLAGPAPALPPRLGRTRTRALGGEGSQGPGLIGIANLQEGPTPPATSRINASHSPPKPPASGTISLSLTFLEIISLCCTLCHIFLPNQQFHRAAVSPSTRWSAQDNSGDRETIVHRVSKDQLFRARFRPATSLQLGHQTHKDSALQSPSPLLLCPLSHLV